MRFLRLLTSEKNEVMAESFVIYVTIFRRNIQYVNKIWLQILLTNFRIPIGAICAPLVAEFSIHLF